MTPGTYYYRVIAADAAGNASAASSQATAVVTSDTTAPNVAISAPHGRRASVAGTVTVTATASDNVGVQSVQFRVDGANVGAADTSSPYSLSLNTTTLSNGTHTLSAVARDAAGNTRTSTNVSVTVDNALPTVSLTAPAARRPRGRHDLADRDRVGQRGRAERAVPRGRERTWARPTPRAPTRCR